MVDKNSTGVEFLLADLPPDLVVFGIRTFLFRFLYGVSLYAMIARLTSFLLVIVRDLHNNINILYA